VLAHGVTYELVVEATSGAGLAGNASVSFSIDQTPPIVGAIADGARSPIDLDCVPSEAPLGCSWSGVTDAESGIVSVEWAMGTKPNLADVHPFTRVPLTTLASTTDAAAAELAPNGAARYFCVLRVVNGAGLTLTTGSDGARLVDASCADDVPSTCADEL
jgi:hypothetical protein